MTEKRELNIEQKRIESLRLYGHPQKHYVRENGWLEIAKKRTQTLNKKRALRYFTLCGLPAYDIKTFAKEGILEKGGTGYDSTFFCERDDTIIEEISRKVSPNYWNGTFEAFVKSIEDNREQREKLRKLNLFPFDIYNLDFTGSCIPSKEAPYSKILEALTRLIDLNRREKQNFDLFLTFRAKKTEDNKNAVQQLKNLLEKNCNDYPNAKKILETIHGNISKLLSNYENFITITIPKYLLKKAEDLNYVMDIYPSYKYKRVSGKSGEYYIANIILSFKYFHRHRGNRNTRLDEPTASDQIHRLYYPTSIEKIFNNKIIDVDKEFKNNPNLKKTFEKKIREIEEYE